MQHQSVTLRDIRLRNVHLVDFRVVLTPSIIEAGPRWAERPDRGRLPMGLASRCCTMPRKQSVGASRALRALAPNSPATEAMLSQWGMSGANVEASQSPPFSLLHTRAATIWHAVPSVSP